MNTRSTSLPPLRIPSLLRKYGLRPKKGLGQNFLVEDPSLQKVVCSAEITKDEVVLEIGAGLGSLTRYLSIHAKSVVAVEIDRNLIPPLREILDAYPNVSIIHGDILDLEIDQLLNSAITDVQSTATSPGQPAYVVVANIPYYITSALIRHLLESRARPNRIILTVQREVATRICAGTPAMSLLALSVQVYGEPRITAKIPAGAFYPPPTVDSAVIRIDLYPLPLIPPPYTETFFHLVKAGFSQRRKNLRNSLSAGLGIEKTEAATLLEAASIDPRRRAQTLRMDEWEALTLLVHEKP